MKILLAANVMRLVVSYNFIDALTLYFTSQYAIKSNG